MYILGPGHAVSVEQNKKHHLTMYGVFFFPLYT